MENTQTYTNITSTLPQTPYKALYALAGDSGQLTPEWASKREVFRSGHRTHYVVETTQLAKARRDLANLQQNGWEVSIQPQNLAGAARISMTAGEDTRVA